MAALALRLRAATLALPSPHLCLCLRVLLLLALLLRAQPAAAWSDISDIPMLRLSDVALVDTQPAAAAGASTSVMQERSASVECALPTFNKSARVQVLPALLSAEEVRGLLAALPPDFNTDRDSVDSLPTFELPVQAFNQPSLLQVSDGPGGEAAGRARARLRGLTAPALERVLPYVRARYACPECVACTQIFRRYSPGERMRHPAHFDTQVMRASRLQLNIGHAWLINQ